MKPFEIDDYVVADLSHLDYVVADLSHLCAGAIEVRASIEAVNPNADPPTFLVATADIQNRGQRAWVTVACLSPAPAIDEALIEFTIGDHALVSAKLDHVSSPLALSEVELLPNRKTNKFRAPLRIALEALFALEGCPAHAGGRGGGYVGPPADTTAVRKSAKHLRATITAFYRADEENRRAERERERASDGMTASERAMTNSEDDFLATRPSERFRRERKRAAIKRAQGRGGMAP